MDIKIGNFLDGGIYNQSMELYDNHFYIIILINNHTSAYRSSSMPKSNKIIVILGYLCLYLGIPLRVHIPYEDTDIRFPFR